MHFHAHEEVQVDPGNNHRSAIIAIHSFIFYLSSLLLQVILRYSCHTRVLAENSQVLFKCVFLSSFVCHRHTTVKGKDEWALNPTSLTSPSYIVLYIKLLYIYLFYPLTSKHWLSSLFGMYSLVCSRFYSD